MFDNYPPGANNQSPSPLNQAPANAPQDIFANVAPNSYDTYPTKTFGPPSPGQMPNINADTGGSLKFLIIGLVTLVFVLIAGAVAYQMVLKPKFQNTVIDQSSQVDLVPIEGSDIINSSDESANELVTSTDDMVVDSDLEIIIATGTQDYPNNPDEVTTSSPVNNLISIDTDNDGVTDDIEALKGTNPSNKDTDSDGLDDGLEINQYLTDPLKADSDSDGLSDQEEVIIYFTDPLSKDTDGDGYEDGVEVKNGYNPKGSGRLTITTNN